MTDFLKITSKGSDALIATFNSFPDAAAPLALDAFTGFVIGNPSHGLRHYPPQRSRTYIRTYRLRGGWYATPAQGKRAYIGNPTPYAIYPMGNPPARHMQQLGWRGNLDVIFSNMTGALRAATLKVIDWLRARVQ